MKFRHAIVALFVSFFVSDLSAQTSWNWSNPSPQGNDLHGIMVKADSFGIAVGDVGTMLTRANGSFGNSVYPVSTALGGICYFKDTVWIVGDGGLIKRSLNNGTSWTDQSYSKKINFHSCFNIDKNDLFVAGDSGIILYSTNAGVNWTKETNNSKKNLNCIANGGRQNMYVVGDSGTILQGINYGSTGYFTITTPHKFNFHGVAMDTAQAFIVGDSGYILQRDIVADALIADSVFDKGVNPFYDVAYANPYVIVVGGNGSIKRSTDNGSTWTSPSSQATEKLFRISLSGDFATSGVAWVVGENGVFLRTANYGSTWSRLDTGLRGSVYATALSPNGDMYATNVVGKSYRLLKDAAHWTLDSLKAGGAPRLTDISFDPNGFGMIATYDVNVLRTIDSGRSWHTIGVNNAAVEILGVATWGSTGLACAANGVIYRSTNKAGSWAATTTNNTQALYDVDISGTSAIGVGTNGTVLYSVDGGAAWTKPNATGTTAQLVKVRFATATNAVAVSTTGVIIRTTDKGVTWATISSGVTTPLNDVAFHDDKNGIIVGDGGVILKTNDGGKTWTKDQSNTLFDLKGAMIVDGGMAYVIGSKLTALVTTNSGLPVELIHFAGTRLSNSDVVLDWSVASEKDNFGYSVERNDNGLWNQVGFRMGLGTSADGAKYSLTDPRATNELLQYRLRQIDLDGSEHLLCTVAVGPNLSAVEDQVVIYPNPIRTDSKIAFTVAHAENARISILNEEGAEVSVVADRQFAAGLCVLDFNTKDLSSGTYHLVISTPTQRLNKEFVIVR